MPSPFPGMDPWLENRDCFPDLHDALIAYFRIELNKVLIPLGFAALSKKRITIEQLPREPDVSIVTPKPRARTTSRQHSIIGLKELDFQPVAVPVEESYIDIQNRDHRLVTSIEILSRTNKIRKTGGREDYLRKQRMMQRLGVNLVEIDLLRRGRHTSLASLDLMKKRFGEFDYHVSVYSAWQPEKIFVAPIRLTDRLPRFGIPLESDVEPVALDLQAAMDFAYDTGAYTMMIDYSKKPQYKLADEQYRWARKILKKQGKH